MALKLYSPKEVSVTVGGLRATGFVDGSFVTIERETDSFSKTVGVDGEVARNSIHNRTGSITFTLMQTSDFNEVVSNYLRQAEGNPRAGVFDVVVEDLLNGSKFEGTGCWVRRAPNAEYSNEVGGFEWIIDCADLRMRHAKTDDVVATLTFSNDNISGSGTFTF